MSDSKALTCEHEPPVPPRVCFRCGAHFCPSCGMGTRVCAACARERTKASITGRRTAQGVAISVMVVAITMVILTVLESGPRVLITRSVRLAIEGYLCWKLAGGSNTARWILAFLMSAGSVMAFIGGTPFTSALGVFYAVCVFLLFVPESSRVFFQPVI